MSESGLISPETIVRILNEFKMLDPIGCYQIGCFHVVTTKEVIEHPSIMIRPVPPLEGVDERQGMIGFLGLINGFVYPETGKVVVERYSDPIDESGVCTFLGYDLVEAELMHQDL